MAVRKKKKNTKTTASAQSNKSTVKDFLARYQWFVGNTQEDKNSMFRNLRYELAKQVIVNDLHSVGSMTGALVFASKIQTALESTHFSLIHNLFGARPAKKIPAVSDASFAALMADLSEDQEAVYEMQNETMGLQTILNFLDKVICECAEKGGVNKAVAAIAVTEIPDEIIDEEEDFGINEEDGDIDGIALKKFLYRAPETPRIDINTIIEMLSWMSIGVMPAAYYPALERFYDEEGRGLTRDIGTVDRIFFAPLVNRLAAVAGEAEILNAELLETAVENANILTLSSGNHAEKPFRLYCPVYSGRATDIEKFISRDFKFRALVTDGNRAFKTLVTNGHPDARLQSSLFRFRREILAALGECSFFKKLVEIENQDEAREFVRQEVFANSPYVLCLAVLSAVTKVRTLRMVKPKTAPEKVMYDRMQCDLMDHIDTLMSELARDRIKPGKTVFVSVKASDLIGKACCCYMNQREMLRAFTEDLTIPSDTDSLETSVRPLAIVRSHPYFIENKDNAGLLFDVLSLVTSLQANGFHDPATYLKSYAAALAEHIKAKKPDWNGFSPDFGAELTEIRELTRDFDFDAWLPWNRKEA